MSLLLKPDHVLVDDHGKPEAVVLSLIKYRQWVRLLEDREDAALLTKAIRTSRGTLSQTELLGQLKRKHLL